MFRPRTVSFETVDVFTGSRFSGNPLAVVFGAQGLDDADLLSITREFNYAETTFVLPPTDPAHTARVRIFTPAGEVPFAGHPNIGTAFVIGQRRALFSRLIESDDLVFEELAGLVPVSLLRDDGGRAVGARLTAPKPLELGAAVDPALAAAAAGLDVQDVAQDRHPPRAASVGLGFLVMALRDGDALARARPSPQAAAALVAAGAPGMVFLYVVDIWGPGQVALRARMFAPLEGVAEDPATGSAAAAVTGLLGVLGGDGDWRVTITQGVELGRPSQIRGRVQVADGGAGRVEIAGDCVAMMAGTLALQD